jgi:hypothetical protein
MELMIDGHDIAFVVVALNQDIVHLEWGVQNFEVVVWLDGYVTSTF